MDYASKGKKAGKPRIPDHLRRRALVSCDRCKKRRIRCSRSDSQESCQSCLEVAAKCESTLPRKTRIYGSVETLSSRYRALDALIKGLFPSRDTNDLEELYAIAKAHNIELPTFNEQEVAEEVFSQPPPTKPASTSPHHSGESARSPSVGSRESEVFGQHDGNTSKVVEEKLVPMPHGPSHYIGPSSSFGFVLTVRNMVAEFNAALRTIQPDDERTKISREFAGSTWSKALDPIVKEESEDSSDGQISQGVSESSKSGQAVNRRARDQFSSTSTAAAARQSKRATVLSLLPTREVTDAFVAAFFEHVHPNYLLFHRPTFAAKYDQMWEQPHTLMRDVEPGWICCIFMMLVFGAQALENENTPQSKQIQHHYLDLVQSRMHQLISATTLINVQALLLLQLYQHNCTERNSAFMLLGCASRMAMALGMHREGTSGGFDEMEKEVRKRIWWTAYIFEQYQCAILGRPCAIEDAEVNVGFPDEMILDGGEALPPRYIEHSVRLARLLSEIRRKVYAAPNGPPNERGNSPKVNIAIQFLLELDTWHNSLPTQLRLESLSLVPKHRRAVILLHIQFNHAQSLVTRPFILRKAGVQLARRLGRHVRSQDLDKEELGLSHACGVFSRKSAQLLHQLLASGSFDGVAWIDAYFIYHSMLILSLDFLARPWEEKDNEEDLARKQAVRDVMGALEHTRLCPTFTILTQVSLQLAKIVGIFDARSEQHEKAEEFRQFMEQQSTTFTFDYAAQESQAGSGNVVNSWFQRGPVELPWDLKDFFGQDGFVAPALGPTFETPMNFGPSYSMGPGDDGGMVAPPPPGAAYTHWTAIDTPYSQPPRGNSIPNSHLPPGRHPGPDRHM